MEQASDKRIERAWAGAQGWITEFTGAPTATLLVNAPAQGVAAGLAQAAATAQNLRLTVIPADKPGAAQFVALETIPEHLARLLAGELAELSANWAVARDAFDLDVHLMVIPLGAAGAAEDAAGAAGAARVSLELDWWSDQVFSEETDNPAQFAALARYFIELQSLFGAAEVFLCTESGLDPAADSDDWVEL